MAKFKITTRKSTVADAISEAYGELQELRDEAQEMHDNAPEGLQQTQRLQTMSENADTLSSNCDSEPDVPENVGAAELTVHDWQPTRKGRGLSRADRCSHACALLGEVVSELERGLEDGGYKGVSNEDVESLRDELTSAKDEAEGLEWPGMFG